jgi:hypothetical protein
VSPLVAILILLLLAVVILVVAAPLRARDPGSGQPEPPGSPGPAPAPAPAGAGSPERAELETAREAKYREIRDSEMDYRTGKLSPEDYAAIDAQLRAEAIEILNRLERLAPPDGDAEGADHPGGSPGSAPDA